MSNFSVLNSSLGLNLLSLAWLLKASVQCTKPSLPRLLAFYYAKVVERRDYPSGKMIKLAGLSPGTGCLEWEQGCIPSREEEWLEDWSRRDSQSWGTAPVTHCVCAEVKPGSWAFPTLPLLGSVAGGHPMRCEVPGVTHRQLLGWGEWGTLLGCEIEGSSPPNSIIKIK